MRYPVRAIRARDVWPGDVIVGPDTAPSLHVVMPRMVGDGNVKILVTELAEELVLSQDGVVGLIYRPYPPETDARFWLERLHEELLRSAEIGNDILILRGSTRISQKESEQILEALDDLQAALSTFLQGQQRK